MIYYTKGSNVYSSEVLLSLEEFAEISKEEYDKRTGLAKAGREEGICVENFDEI